MDEQDILRNKLEVLKNEHRDVSTMIDDLMREQIVNQLAVQRLKKKKLLIRDQMNKINNQLLPDIIA